MENRQAHHLPPTDRVFPNGLSVRGDGFTGRQFSHGSEELLRGILPGFQNRSQRDERAGVLLVRLCNHHAGYLVSTGHPSKLVLLHEFGHEVNITELFIKSWMA